MKRKNMKYTPEFKIEVAKAYLSGEYGGKPSVAKKFGVGNTRVWEWKKQLSEKGEESFYYETRGRYKKDKTKKEYNKLSVEDKLKYKEMECDILKKLSALLKKLGEH
ncbi:MAG: transposase [Clostridia bacterium]|jgi:transposase-like protein|nr:transposase [Clostridia bacterium]